MSANFPRQAHAVRLNTSSEKFPVQKEEVGDLSAIGEIPVEPAKEQLPRRSSRIAAQRPNSDVPRAIDEVINKANIRGAEAQRLRDIRSLEDLQLLVGIADHDHKQNKLTTKGGRLQDAMVRINDFGKVYSSILGSFRDAVPNSGGHAIWALLGGFFLVAERKDSREKSITEFLSGLRYSLPRNKEYQKLYKSSTIINLHERLHVAVTKALLEALKYFRKGSLRRITSVMAIEDTVAEAFNEVLEISSEISAQSMLELCNEIRDAHEKTVDIQNEARKANSNLLEVRKQLSQVTEQLEAAQVQNMELKQHAEEAHQQSIKRTRAELAKTLVPLKYDAGSIIENCRQQIRCSNKRRQQLVGSFHSPTIQQWSISSAKVHPKLSWITDKTRKDSAISLVAVEAIQRYAPTNIVLHSLSQVGIAASPLPQSARTATTIIKEATFQLMHHEPELWLKYETHDDDSEPFVSPSLSTLVQRLVGLLDAYTSSRAQNTTIYWVIDRIDTVFWKTKNSALGLSESPHRNEFTKAEQLRVASNTVNLEEFLQALRNLRAEKWEIKMLVTSWYSSEALMRSHGVEADDEDEVQTWMSKLVV